ncbi:C-C motif chemokine 20-like [Oncorhynchus keta]|uniref:C-C motif chemokine 20-like n=1 Tax=Oncorhynchus keta TaxID=8018 RepID=UPI0015FDFCD4|nr:C-C motif chemokine 20-like [Oncorhynchus keta]XP_052333335.1 C-C motif chemokine 20-like [Oncorhynchus keta]XP_052367288.1 C-C motif chemokine 20-like [Oncorhynchus keta]
MAQIRAPVIVLLVLLTVGLFAVEVSAAKQGFPRGCCTSYSQGRIDIPLIRGFSVQTVIDGCNIDAIIFHTVRGRFPCVDPTKGWVMKAVRKLRERAEQLKKKRS